MKIFGILGQAGAGKDTIGMMLEQEAGAATLALADPMKEFVQRVFGFTDLQLWGPSDMRNAPDRRFRHPAWWNPWAQERRRELDASIMRRVRCYSTFQWLRDLMPEASTAELDAAWRRLIYWADRLLRDTWYTGSLTPRLVLQTLGTEWGRTVNEDMWIDYGIRHAQKLLGAGTPAVAITDCRFLNEAKKLHAVGHVWRVTRPGFDGSLANNAGIANHRSERDQHSDEIAQYVNVEITNNGSLDDLRERVICELQNMGAQHAEGEELQRCG